MEKWQSREDFHLCLALALFSHKSQLKTCFVLMEAQLGQQCLSGLKSKTDAKEEKNPCAMEVQCYKPQRRPTSVVSTERHETFHHT